MSRPCLFLSLVLAAAACGKRSTARHDAAPVATAAPDAASAVTSGPTPDAATPAPTPDRPLPAEAAALLDALAAVDTQALRAWEEDARRLRYRSPDPEAPPRLPAEVQGAIAALVAWDGSGAPMPVGCDGEPMKSLHGALMVSRATILAAAPESPEVHAVLRLGHALRAETNDPAAIVFGAGLAVQVALDRAARHLPRRPASPLDPEDGLPGTVARASVRCAADALAKLAADPTLTAQLGPARRGIGLPDLPDPVATERALVEAFWTETLRQLDAAGSPAAMAAVVEQRIDAARANRESVLVRVVGPPYAVQQALEALAEWRDPKPRL